MDRHHKYFKLSLKKSIDQWGAILGFLCAVHCMLTPLSMVLVQITGLGSLWTTQGEAALLGVALLFTIPSFWEAWHRDRQSLVLVSFLLALGIIIISHLLESSHHYDSLLVESTHSVDLSHHEEDHEHSMIGVIFASLGGLGLMFAHLLNIKEKREALVECCS